MLNKKMHHVMHNPLKKSAEKRKEELLKSTY